MNEIKIVVNKLDSEIPISTEIIRFAVVSPNTHYFVFVDDKGKNVYKLEVRN